MSRTSPGRRALSALTWLRRNPRRVIPIALIQALVTALLVAVITPMNIFESTGEAYLEPLKHFTIVTPQRQNAFDEELGGVLDANPHLEKRLAAKMLWIETPALIGDLVSPLIALSPDDQRDLLDRLGLRLTEGSLPGPLSAGAALHRDVLRARGFELGDEFGQIVDPTHSTPGRFEVVGILDGPCRLGVIDLAYTSIPDFVLARRPSFQVIYARSGVKAASDAYLREAKDGEDRRILRVLDEAWARREMESTLENLPVLIGFLTGAVAVIVAIVTTLLVVIAFQSRVEEFALLLAVGHRRGRLMRKLITETAATAVLGWGAGLALGVAAVALYDLWLLQPRALVIQVIDARPFLFSLSVPVLSIVVGALALRRRLGQVDPVTILQRRGA